jgi:DNA (cytosine-5)-methyltransferase 1
MNEGIVLVELFSGIGGFAKGLMDAGIKIKDHYFSEIDKHAIANYKYNFPDAKYIGSVKDVRGIGIKPDVITFGWPCQDNSIAGKRKGQRHGTRSGLLFEAGRIIMELKPRYFIAENVKGLYSVNEGNDFYQSIRFLTYFDTDCPQYTVEMQLFNTDWFLPQNRERTYFVGHIGGKCIERVFPFGEDMPEVNELREQTTNTLTARYYGSQQGGGIYYY